MAVTRLRAAGGVGPYGGLTMPFAVQPAPVVIVAVSAGHIGPALRRLSLPRPILPSTAVVAAVLRALHEAPLRWLTTPFAMQPSLAVAVTRLRAAGGVGPYGG